MRPITMTFHHRAALGARLAALLVPAIMLAAPQAAAKSRVVSCRIESSGKLQFKGRCLFTSDTNGSFSLGSVGKPGRFFRTILSVNVYVVKRGVAEVRGLTKHGINSRWGPAMRSKRDPACWVGSDFRICAW
jgi:hypothetical protein